MLSTGLPEIRTPASMRIASARKPTTVPSLLILGTDAALSASPATPVQLSHACLLAGYHAVIPSSWGDELIAAGVLERMRYADGPRVQCSCPLVARRLATHGGTISDALLQFVSPPVATALYLRAAYAPTRPHITFAGGCPGAAHESLDAAMSSEELLDSLSRAGISLLLQPTEFDSVIPPDRRRYYSEPGGVPSRQALGQLSAPAELTEIKGDDVVLDLAQLLLSESRTLIDPSLVLRCCCSGAVGTAVPGSMRERVRELEPPRAPTPVVDHSVSLALGTDVTGSIRVSSIPAVFSICWIAADSAFVVSPSSPKRHVALRGLFGPKPASAAMRTARLMFRARSGSSAAHRVAASSAAASGSSMTAATSPDLNADAVLLKLGRLKERTVITIKKRAIWLHNLVKHLLAEIVSLDFSQAVDQQNETELVPNSPSSRAALR